MPYSELKQKLTDRETRERYKSALAEAPLRERHKKIVAYRLGFEDGNIHTLQETGDLFGVTRQNVKYLEVKALEAIEGNL